MVECVDFSPYTPQFQQKLKCKKTQTASFFSLHMMLSLKVDFVQFVCLLAPHTPVNWMKKRNNILGNLSTFQSLLVQCLEVYLESPEASSEATGLALVSILSVLFTNLALANTVKEALTSLIEPIMLFYKQAASEPPIFTSQLLEKVCSFFK